MCVCVEGRARNSVSSICMHAPQNSIEQERLIAIYVEFNERKLSTTEKSQKNGRLLSGMVDRCTVFFFLGRFFCLTLDGLVPLSSLFLSQMLSIASRLNFHVVPPQQMHEWQTNKPWANKKIILISTVWLQTLVREEGTGAECNNKHKRNQKQKIIQEMNTWNQMKRRRAELVMSVHESRAKKKCNHQHTRILNCTINRLHLLDVCHSPNKNKFY